MSLSVYVKPTNFCTIDCEHCYLSEDVRANKELMTDKTLKNTAELVIQLAKREGHDSIHIIWHGGEPLMVNPSWYHNAVKILDSVFGKGNYTQSIQTSLIPYNSKWAPVIKDYFDSFIGSSIDFSQRKVGDSADTYIDLWLKRVERARADGFTIIPMMVPSRMEIGKGEEILDWFIKNDFHAFSIERYSDFTGKMLDAPKNKHHSDFMIELFDGVIKRLRNGEKASYINVIAAAINGVRYEIPGDRWGGDCQREFLVVEPDGGLNTCPDRTSFEKSFSNANEGVVKFMNAPPRKEWIRIQNINHKENHCMSCEYNTWCKSGCPITNNVKSNKESECSGYKSFLNHVKSHLENENDLNLLLNYAKPLGEEIIKKIEF